MPTRVSLGVQVPRAKANGPAAPAVNGAYFGPRFFGGHYFGRRYFG
jgi:hypothetical protein